MIVHADIDISKLYLISEILKWVSLNLEISLYFQIWNSSFKLNIVLNCQYDSTQNSEQRLCKNSILKKKLLQLLTKSLLATLYTT